ncbi:MAG: hypothetical protein ACRDTE_10800 [Pseudonocardiaceae bacterium]
MAEGPTVGLHRFDGQSLQTMYSWMHEQGSGPGSAETARAALTDLGTLLLDVESDLRSALSQIGIEWEGAAAAAAGRAIQQSAIWVSDAGKASMTSCRPAADQGEAFTSTRAQIQQPHSAEYGFGDAMADGFNAAADIGTGGLNPFEVQTDVDHAAKQNAAHQAAAVQAMNTWNSAAQTNLAAMPPVQAPHPIAVEATPVGGTHQPVVGYSGATPGGPAGGGTYSGAPSPVAAQQVGSATALTGAGAGAVSFSPTGSGGSGGPGGSGGTMTPGARIPTPGQSGRVGGLSPRSGTGGSGIAGGVGPGGAGVGPGGAERARSRSGPGGAGAGEGLLRPPLRSGGLAGSMADSPERTGAAGSAARRGGAPGSFMQPAATGTRGRGTDDDEHQNKYWQKDSEIFEDNRLVAPPVIGEDPQR